MKSRTKEARSPDKIRGGRVGSTRDGDVLIAELSNGAVNAIDGGVVEQFSLLLEEAGDDPGVKGLVVTGASDKFFSIGFDIPRLYPLSRSEFEPFFEAFNRLCLDLYAFPKPTVAAIEGHAVAGGCILAICCDRRIVADGRNLMGLNTVRLGVPVPLLVRAILGRLLGEERAAELLARGEFHAPAGAIDLGLADEARPRGEVLRAAIAAARSLASRSPEALAASKRARAEQVLEEVGPALEERNRDFVDAWYSPQARRLLHEAIGRFRKDPGEGT